MKIVATHTLIQKGPFPQSRKWKQVRNLVHKAIRSVVWPPGSKDFIIHPQSGKKRGEGNGVKPIKDAAIIFLEKCGWIAEFPWPIEGKKNPGKMDAILETKKGFIGFEWETGNISSSHRALNKLCLGILQKKAIGGILVVPSRKLYRYLTDRIGNIDELEPYFDLWASVSCKEGVLEIVVIEQDGESLDVPKIPKGTDGRNLI
ncbi:MULTISPECIES: hypothetical protein [unclassified Nitrospina]|uniref:hypothetical protein n=1 Tax=unclassified Nitrospina TaxID=2638683 RepID=UPI003F96324E